jgi:hypothetical protein
MSMIGYKSYFQIVTGASNSCFVTSETWTANPSGAHDFLVERFETIFNILDIKMVTPRYVYVIKVIMKDAYNDLNCLKAS